MERARLFGLLWAGLAVAYLAASAAGRLDLSLVAIGLLVGTAVALRHVLAGVLLGTVLAILAWHWGDRFAALAYLPPLAAFAFMAYFFGRTLKAGRVPFIVRVARMEHPDLPQDMEAYARRLTALWTACFVMMVVASAVLAFALPFADWARWVNGLGYGLPAILFAGELAYRTRRFPQRSHATLAHLVRNVVLAIREDARGAAAVAPGR
jgi:uncharacterized membrane protein